MASYIIGTGSFLPDRIVTNSELEKATGLNEDEIKKRTGIIERRMVSDEEASSDIAAAASLNAISNADIKADEIDYIILSTTSPDMLFPSTACLIQKKISALKASAFDISASCSGFIFALSIADQYLKNGMGDIILVAASEVKSKFINKRDKATSILFSDGAGVLLLKNTKGDRGILSTHLYSDGSKGDLIHLSRYCQKNSTLLRPFQYIEMQGGKLFKIAVTKIEEAIIALLNHHKISLSDIDHIILHQANLRIINHLIKRLNIPRQKVVITIDRYGNTSSSTIPIALDYAVKNGRIKSDDLILLASFGGGITWGSALIRW
ncbi:MAG: beta-ketoacyl-ACP synthase III [Nitrospirota bacterium]